MSQIRSYEVAIPPTAEEVGRFALEATYDKRPLTLTVREAPTDLKPEGEISEVSIVLRAFSFAEDLSVRKIRGELEASEGETVLINVSGEPNEPATLTTVTN